MRNFQPVCLTATLSVIHLVSIEIANAHIDLTGALEIIYREPFEIGHRKQSRYQRRQPPLIN